MSKATRQKVYDKFKGHCAYCGCELELRDMQVDHIFPKAKEHWVGNKNMQEFTDTKIPENLNDLENLFPACRQCNFYKSVYSIEKFREQLSKQIERLNLRSFNYRLAKKYGLIEETGKEVKFYFEMEVINE